MTYPDNCISGIPLKDHLTKDGQVATHHFYFKQENEKKWKGKSINWEDNSTVIGFTLNQRKPDSTLQFKVGVAIIPRRQIDRINRLPNIDGLLSYERQTLVDNPFHGNILLRPGTPKSIMRQSAATLALAVSKVELRKSK